MTDERLDAIRAALDIARNRGETSFDTGFEYATGEPVRVFVRKRGHRWDFGDDGRAVELAGKPAGWLVAAERVVVEEGMNVNRAGVVFVPAVERPDRDLVTLAMRLGAVSHAVFAELLELD
jgi:hypothetical protein